MSVVVVNAEVDGQFPATVVIEGSRVKAVGDPERLGAVAARATVLDAKGGAVIPGLHDHHIHLRALAASAGSVTAGPDFVPAVRAAAARDDWVRVVGYHDSFAGPLDRHALDRIVASTPVRVQHRSGSMWILNSRALEAVGLSDHPTGCLSRHDRWLRGRVPSVAADLHEVSRAAAAMGVTGFTDATPDMSTADVASLYDAVESGEVLQRLHVMTPIGVGVASHRRVSLGPVKVLLDDETLPGVDDLAKSVAEAHRDGRPVAVHCVTRVQTVVAVTAFTLAGPVPGDRLEHAAVVPDELRATVRSLGLTIVTQPHFIAERGDAYLADVDDEDPASLYPLRSLADDGIAVAAGTDAPFGSPDPWATMRAAVRRTAVSGAVLGPAERVSPARALRLFFGATARPAWARRVVPGAVADLCVLREPLRAVEAVLHAEAVAATIVDGTIVYDEGKT